MCIHVSIGQLETNSTPTYQGDGPAKEPVRHVRMAAHCRNLGKGTMCNMINWEFLSPKVRVIWHVVLCIASSRRFGRCIWH